MAEFLCRIIKSKKNGIYFILAAIVISAGFGVYTMTRQSYVIIIENADSADIAEMKNILTGKGIPTKVTDNKAGIAVNVRNSDAAHLELFRAGYPKNGLAFADAISAIKITAAESDRNYKLEELNEAKLSEQLKLFRYVKDAKVKIVKSEALTDKSKTKASVVISGNGEIKAEEVQKMTLLVLNSLEGLDYENVSITYVNRLNIEAGRGSE